MSKDEAIYGLTVLLAMNGVAALDDGDKFVQIMPLTQAPKAELHAPRAEAGASLIAPDSVPELRREVPWRGIAVPPDPRSQQNTADLFAYYAKLVGREVAPSEVPSSATVPVVFKVQTPLTKAELVYAIETTFALNYFVAIPVGDNAIRLGHVSERKKVEQVERK